MDGKLRGYPAFALSSIFMAVSFLGAMLMASAALGIDDADRSDEMLAGCLVMASISLVMMVIVIITQLPVYQKMAEEFNRDWIDGVGFVIAPAVFWPLAAISRQYAVTEEDGQTASEAD